VDVYDKSTRSKNLVLNSCLHEAITRTQTLRKEIELLCNECFSQITDVSRIDLLSRTLFLIMFVVVWNILIVVIWFSNICDMCPYR